MWVILQTQRVFRTRCRVGALRQQNSGVTVHVVDEEACATTPWHTEIPLGNLFINTSPLG